MKGLLNIDCFNVGVSYIFLFLLPYLVNKVGYIRSHVYIFALILICYDVCVADL